MRYFTRGWLNGEYSDKDFEATAGDYKDRIKVVGAALSPAVARLAETNLHDGVIEYIEWDERRMRLSLALVIGDLQHGYAGIELSYEGAMLGEERVETLRDLGRDRRVRVLCDEVDVDAQGDFQHRLIFWPHQEITIDFKHLALVVNARPDRRIEPGDAFYAVEQGE